MAEKELNQENVDARGSEADANSNVGKSAWCKEKLLNELETSSPLDTFSILEQVEMYDEMDAWQTIDNVYKEFESGENGVENIVLPVFTSIVDGLLDSLGGDKKNPTAFGTGKEMGLTSTRIVQECRTFRYNETDVNTQVLSEVTVNTPILEADPNINQMLNEAGENKIHNYYRQKTTAEAHGDKFYNYSFTDKQRKAAIERARNEDGKPQDAYTGESLHETTDEAKAANDYAHRAEVDHVIPLANVHAQLKSNCLLTDEDVRRIANIDDNLAVTSHDINNPKRAKSNEEYAKENKDKLNRKTRRNMVKKSKEAQKKIDQMANKAVIKNMQDPGQLKKLEAQMNNVVKDAAAAGAKLGIGNAIIELLKPLYYEMADSFRNGFTDGVGAQSFGDAFKIRIGRVKDHLRQSLAGLGLGSLTDLIKSLISSIISAIVDLFFGIVRDLLKLLQKGIPIAVSAFKILFDKTKSPAERGDAVVKLIGSSLIAILGGMLIDKVFKEEGLLKSVFTCLLSGCGSLFFMMFMDKIDLFSAKAEKRQARIREIFDARRAELHERASFMQVEVLDMLKKQRLCFDDLLNGAVQAVEQKNISGVVSYSYALADFFKVELEYSTTAEFVQWWDCQQVIRI